MLLAGKYGYEKLSDEPLYPDQMVFFADTFYQDIDTLEEGKAVASSTTGEMVMRMGAKKALTLTETLARFDVIVNVHGGGYTGQAGAIRHGIARALVKADADLKDAIKKAGFLTRDPRMKERKKYGLKAARRAPQFSKR